MGLDLEDGGCAQPARVSLPVCGVNLDTQTRCQHYRGTTDIIAIKMRCCRVYYACKDCHSALANHPIEVWQESEWDQKAILCGACGTELTIHEYMASESRCQACGAQFNPECRNHYHLYFQVGNGSPLGKRT